MADALDFDSALQPQEPLPRITDDVLGERPHFEKLWDSYRPLPASNFEGDRVKVSTNIPRYVSDAMDGILALDGLPRAVFKSRAEFLRWCIILGLEFARRWAHETGEEMEGLEDEVLQAMFTVERLRGTTEARARVTQESIAAGQAVMLTVHTLLSINEPHRAATDIMDFVRHAQRMGQGEHGRFMFKSLIMTGENQADIGWLVRQGLVADPEFEAFLVKENVLTLEVCNCDLDPEQPARCPRCQGEGVVYA